MTDSIQPMYVLLWSCLQLQIANVLVSLNELKLLLFGQPSSAYYSLTKAGNCDVGLIYLREREYMIDMMYE